MTDVDPEAAACTPYPLDPSNFNPDCELPYGCTVDHVRAAMEEFREFLRLINISLNGKRIPRLESFLMPANFSSIVGEFMTSTIPNYCTGLAKNNYHNGHPDMVPTGMFQNDAVQHSTEGIEIKGSRYLKAWQGHNAEDAWLMVFVFEANRPKDRASGVPPQPFRFIKVVGARLEMDDWAFSGRSGTSRRTITASVKSSGFVKMEANWIYRDPELRQS